MGLCREKLAVLDLTHGGIPIAKKLAALGNEVYAVDVYGTVDPGLLQELEEKHGIHCSKTPLPAFGFDRLIAPVHLDPAYSMLAEARNEGKKIISHHEIVGEILKKDSRLSGIKIIEVTGVKAKTSTASLLADMLSRKFEVVLHTSRGLEAWNESVSSLISRGLSITPGSILVAVEKVFEAGLRPDYFIFEISIGGTGTADFGILTTLSPDYGIANNTTLASEAKLQLVKNAKLDSVLLINAGAKKALEAAKTSQAKVLTFKDPFNKELLETEREGTDFSLEIEYRKTESAHGFPGSSLSKTQSESPELPVTQMPSGYVLHFMYRGDETFSVSLLSGYNISAYRTAFTAASAAALELGVECKAVVAVLGEFRGLSGRMQEKEVNGISLIDNSNSGMDILSAEKALEYALLKKKDEKKSGGIILVLGEEASQVCEGLPPAPVQDFIEKYGAKCRQIILVGERMKMLAARNTSHADSLPEGLLKASELAEKDDIIISSVKCFR
jgi:UDP-N-acetylmuramyl pentapeptide synthase